VPENSRSRPHILFLFPDQLRADHLACAGHPAIRTPNIDRLAAEGVRFASAYTTSPLCTPTRHTLARGLYPHNSNCWMDPDCLDAGADTYMKRLQVAGFRTAMIGKAHFYWQEGVDLKPYEPYMHALGFDDLYEAGGTWSNIGVETVYTDYLKERGLADVFDRYYSRLDRMSDVERRFLAEPGPLPPEHVIDSWIGRKACDYVRSYDDDRPSFLFVGFQGPHEPFDAPGRYATMYDPADMPDPIEELPFGDWLPDRCRRYHRYAQYFQPGDPRRIKEIRANYCGKISLIDDQIGAILAAYEERGWLDNTVVILSSDHGDALGDHNRISKSMFFESMCHVPLTLRLPGGPAEKVVDGLVEVVDLYPTLLELAGSEIPRFHDGLSLLPLARGEVDSVRDDVLGEVHVQTMIRTRTAKYVADRSGDSLQLFDLEADPLEQTNLVGHPDYADLERDMRDRLLRRLLSSTYIMGDRDPSYSAHTSVGTDS